MLIPKSLFRKGLLWKGKVGIRLRRILLSWLLKSVGKNVSFIGWPGMSYPQNISIGDGSTINHFVFLGARGGITIGSRVRISNHVILETGGLDQDPQNREHIASPIVLEDNVWIASGAVVLGGVRVGRNSIVAAGAVVTRDVPSDSIALGIPAKARPLGKMADSKNAGNGSR
jgi:maltose O-acetyltransferase